MGTGDALIEEWESGWRSSDDFICSGCVSDSFLAAAVSDAVIQGQSCSFCGTDPAAEFDVFMDAFMVGVRNCFEQVENGYVFPTVDSWDLPGEFDELAADRVAATVTGAIQTCLVDKTYASRWWLALEPHQAYSSAWREFREQIMYRTRFVFWVGKDDAEDYEGAGQVSVSKVLKAIGELLRHFTLVVPLPAGTRIWRARGHDDLTDSANWGAHDLGTNSPERSTSSTRMSPAGIPLFYGAEKRTTALDEVSPADDREYFTVAEFTSTAAITVIDLTRVPQTPSVFDPELGRWHGELRFLNELVADLRKPVDNARSNLDYVPTQVFCEYFLRVFDDTDVRGLVWTSAAAAGRCFALDIPQSHCVAAVDPAVTHTQLHLHAASKSVYRRTPHGFIAERDEPALSRRTQD